MSLTHASFEFIRKLLRQRSAISLDERKSYLVETRLAPLARRAGLSSVEQLIGQLRINPGHRLMNEVIDAMTTNETSFFRDGAPFDTLRDTLLPEIIARREQLRTINIWSVGCSSGQEPYSIAMLLRESFSHLSGWNLRLLASDLSAEALEQARHGRYSELETTRGLPHELRHKYFHHRGDRWEVSDELRQMVDFRLVNLVQDWPSLPPMDVILLRNVLVYFDMETTKHILAKVRGFLHPSGYLVLGGSETTVHVDAAYEPVRANGFSYFRLRER